ncbi:hypothetical protein ACFXPT_35430 [Streptomyces goshikiensis]|uniref:hypothetical protein n=1 Tax=Streptomyces goshikiensis TaxID=1942 RepID=UPI00367907B3
MVHTHGVFLRIRTHRPGVIPITVVRHPAAQATAAAMPSPYHRSVPAIWAH